MPVIERLRRLISRYTGEARRQDRIASETPIWLDRGPVVRTEVEDRDQIIKNLFKDADNKADAELAATFNGFAVSDIPHNTTVSDEAIAELASRTQEALMPVNVVYPTDTARNLQQAANANQRRYNQAMAAAQQQYDQAAGVANQHIQERNNIGLAGGHSLGGFATYTTTATYSGYSSSYMFTGSFAPPGETYPANFPIAPPISPQVDQMARRIAELESQLKERQKSDEVVKIEEKRSIDA